MHSSTSAWSSSVRISIGSRDFGAQNGRAHAPNAEPTVRHALEAYLERGRKKGLVQGTLRHYRRHLEMHCADWLDWPLSKLSANRLAILERHRVVTELRGPTAANHFVRTIRALYRNAQRFHPELPPCPSVVVDFNPEPPRKEVIEDWAEWWALTSRLKNDAVRDWYRFLVFSGMRRTAAVEVRLEHVNLAEGFIFVPRPKGGPSRAFHLPLSKALVVLVKKRQELNAERFPGCPWLFPSVWSASGHLESCAVVGLPAAHVHRHSYATAAKAAGIGDFDLQLLLNHKIAAITGRYIHASLLGDHLRGCQEKVSQWIVERIRNGRAGTEYRPNVLNAPLLASPEAA